LNQLYNINQFVLQGRGDFTSGGLTAMNFRVGCNKG